jgi:outer membrane immunogenic protein
MKLKLFASAALCMLPFYAYAADLPSKTLLIHSPIPFTWEGIYLGANAGYGWSNSSINVSSIQGSPWGADPDYLSNPNGNPGIVGVGAEKLHSNSFLGGVQIGYNYQISHVVLGLEADADYLHLEKAYSTISYPGLNGGTYQANGSFKSNWLFTIRPRLGLTFNRLLIYVTGGVAFTENTFNQTISFNGYGLGLPYTNGNVGQNSVSNSKSYYGWTLGGGAEWSINERWSLKAEYLYANLGNHKINSTFIQTYPEPMSYTLQHKEHNNLNLARIGINYHF